MPVLEQIKNKGISLTSENHADFYERESTRLFCMAVKTGDATTLERSNRMHDNATTLRNGGEIHDIALLAY